MIPFEASVFVKQPEKIRRLLLRSDVCPINDSLLDIWENKFKILLLYGSYGSGKSIFFADQFINHAIEDEYFRGYFGRKILEDVRGSVHKTITDRIKDLNKEHLFEFSDKPNGSMNIVCKQNYNMMLPFGAADPKSLKSVKDPSHFWLEELDQYSFADFGLIYSRLRTTKADTQLYGSFNTERVYQSHWIRKMLFDGEYASQAHRKLLNYTDNYFIDQKDYLDRLKLTAGGNMAILNAIAYGHWGVVRTGGEFWKQFSETRHVKDVSYASGVVWVSCDENVNPYVTMTVWQVRNQNIIQIMEVLARDPYNNAPKAAGLFCDYLDRIHHKDMVFVCGDPSASKRSTVDERGESFYQKFIAILNNRGYRTQNKVMKSAPEVALSATFVNDIYENNLNGWEIIIGSMCFESIEDYLLVKEDAEGKMQKTKEKEKESGVTFEPRGHISDSKRYVILTILANDFENYKEYRSELRGKAAYFG